MLIFSVMFQIYQMFPKCGIECGIDGTDTDVQTNTIRYYRYGISSTIMQKRKAPHFASNYR